MIINNNLAGLFPDVAFHNDALHVSFAAEGKILVQKFNGSSFETVFEAGNVGNGYARLRSNYGKLYLIYVPFDGKSIIFVNITDGVLKQHTHGTFWTWPGAIGPDTYWIVSASEDGTQNFTEGYDLNNERIFHGPHIGGSQGLAWVDSNNSPVTNDDNRGVEGFWQLYNPQYCLDGTFTGEGVAGGCPVVKTGVRTPILDGQICYVPKITSYRDLYCVVTGNYRTINFIYDITNEDLGIVTPPVGDIFKVNVPRASSKIEITLV